VLGYPVAEKLFGYRFTDTRGNNTDFLVTI